MENLRKTGMGKVRVNAPVRISAAEQRRRERVFAERFSRSVKGKKRFGKWEIVQ